MTDKLVDFLRHPLSYPPRSTIEVMLEAADEIERLRDMLGRTQEEAGELLHAKAALHGHIKRLEDENERLRRELSKVRAAAANKWGREDDEVKS